MRIQGAFFFALLVAGPLPAHASKAALTINCLGTEMTIQFKYNDAIESGGQASSQPITFRINQDPLSSDAINVNPTHNSVCIAKIDSDHIIKRGWHAFDPTKLCPPDIIKVVDVESQVFDNQTIHFILTPLDAKPGSVTLTFSVEYLDSEPE